MKRMIVAVVLLAGCGGAGLQVADKVPDKAVDKGLEACGADQAQGSIGQLLADVQGGLPEAARIIPPDSVVTQDFRPDRMNVDLDAAGVIARIWCG